MSVVKFIQFIGVTMMTAVVLSGCQTGAPLAGYEAAGQPGQSAYDQPESGDAPPRDNAVFVYGGKWSDNRFIDILRLESELRGSYLAAVGYSRTLHRFNEHLHLEGEANVARHWGKQSHFEVNAAANLRWNAFPWDRFVNTSFAYGLGPSYAFGRPVIEERRNRPLSRGLVFMIAELTFAPPKQRASPWEGFIRIHHRSGAFGVVSDAGGSNFITSGARYRF